MGNAMEEMDPEQTTEQAGQIRCGEKWGGRSGLWRWHESRTQTGKVRECSGESEHTEHAGKV